MGPILKPLVGWLLKEYEYSGVGKRAVAPAGLGTPQFVQRACLVGQQQDDAQSCGIWVIENAWARADGAAPSTRTSLARARAHAVLLVKGLVMLGQMQHAGKCM